MLESHVKCWSNVDHAAMVQHPNEYYLLLAYITFENLEYKNINVNYAETLS